MSGFSIDVPPHRRAAARHLSDVRRKLLRAFARQQISFPAIAMELGITTSRLERELTGELDITLGRVGELADLLGCEVSISFPAKLSASPSTEGSERETPAEPLPPLNTDGETSSSSATEHSPSGRQATPSQAGKEEQK
jgi:transcriptional regulator with XRE-family HTH domain